MKATTAIVLAKKVQKQDGTYPVKLRVTFQRKQKYYGIDHSYTEDDFNDIYIPNNKGKYKRGTYKIVIGEDGKDVKLTFEDVRKLLETEKGKADAIVESLSVFSWIAFEQRYLSGRGDLGDVYSAFNAAIKELMDAGQVGTATGYRCALKSFKKHKRDLRFTDVTPDFLRKYERWMLQKEKNSPTTVSMYARALRALYNKAIDDNVVKREQYPFHREDNSKGYKVPDGRNTKKALSASELSKICNYEAIPGTSRQKALDYWLFSLYCNGMNIADIAKLQYKDVDFDDLTLTYIRAKTATTKDTKKPLRVPIDADVLEIINRWGKNPVFPEQYIFPIIKNTIIKNTKDAIKVKQDIQQATKLVNKHIKIICTELGIKQHVTSYAARHSYANRLKQLGYSIDFIREQLDHSNSKTTELYLKDFDTGQAREANKKAKDFSEVAHLKAV